MKWIRDERNEWNADFAGRGWRIFRLGPFRYRLWAHDISESFHWTLYGAKKQALWDAIEYAVWAIWSLDDRLSELESSTSNTGAPEPGAGGTEP